METREIGIEETQRRLDAYFTEKLETFGATAKGVDYNGERAQQLRFAELARIIDPAKKFSIIDYGCGYGAMFDFLNARGWEFDYYGVDRIDAMVRAGRASHERYPNAHFTTDEGQLPVADYLVAASIFNIKLDATDEAWRDFVCRTLARMNRLCAGGFAFDMLTRYSDADQMARRPDLFYGDPLFFFDFCKREFSRNVALLHDYGLYDFTVLVRKAV